MAHTAGKKEKKKSQGIADIGEKKKGGVRVLTEEGAIEYTIPPGGWITRGKFGKSAKRREEKQPQVPFPQGDGKKKKKRGRYLEGERKKKKLFA